MYNTKNYKSKIYKYDLDGNFVKEYESILDAVFQNNITNSVLHKALNREIPYCKGFLWSKFYKIKVQPFEKKQSVHKYKSVHKYDLMGNYICSYSNYKSAAEELGCSKSQIHRALNLEIPYCKGFLWLLEKTDKIKPYTGKRNRKPQGTPIGLYDLDGNLIERFLNITDASKKLNMSKHTVRRKFNKITEMKNKSKYNNLIFKTIIDKEIISSDELTETV